jgi:hypothetical protein
MLPAWATVAIAIGGSALVAFSGALTAYLAYRSGGQAARHEERDAWRSRQFEGAEAFIAAYTRGFASLYRAANSTGETRAAALNGGMKASDEALIAGIRIGLLFGHGSPADDAAGKVKDLLEQGLESIEAGEIEKAWTCWEQGDSNQVEFITRAHEELRPS